MGFPHFFLKEVYEQPESIARTLAGRIENGKPVLEELSAIDIQRIRRVVLTGCGSAFFRATPMYSAGASVSAISLTRSSG